MCSTFFTGGEALIVSVLCDFFLIPNRRNALTHAETSRVKTPRIISPYPPAIVDLSISHPRISLDLAVSFDLFSNMSSRGLKLSLIILGGTSPRGIRNINYRSPLFIYKTTRHGALQT